MANLTQLLQFGRGLRQLPDATVEVLPDGTTLTFNTSNQLYIPNGAITTSKIADSAITTAKIGDNQVTTDKIADGQITKAKMTDTGRAIVDIRFFQGISSTCSIPDAPFLLSGWKLLRVNVLNFGWTSTTGNYWQVEIHLIDTSGTDTYLGTILCSPPSNYPYWSSTVIGPFTADKDYVISCKFVKQGTPPNFMGYIEFVICPTDKVYKW